MVKGLKQLSLKDLKVGDIIFLKEGSFSRDQIDDFVNNNLSSADNLKKAEVRKIEDSAILVKLLNNSSLFTAYYYFNEDKRVGYGINVASGRFISHSPVTYIPYKVEELEALIDLNTQRINFYKPINTLNTEIIEYLTKNCFNDFMKKDLLVNIMALIDVQKGLDIF